MKTAHSFVFEGQVLKVKITAINFLQSKRNLLSLLIGLKNNEPENGLLFDAKYYCEHCSHPRGTP